jgi:hypothetical protein
MAQSRGDVPVPMAPWLARALQDLARARARVEAEHPAGPSGVHPLVAAIRYAATLLSAAECDRLPRPALAATAGAAGGAGPSLTLAFRRADRSLRLRVTGPHAFHYVMSFAVDGEDGPGGRATTDERVEAGAFDVFRGLARWLADGRLSDGPPPGA